MELRPEVVDAFHDEIRLYPDSAEELRDSPLKIAGFALADHEALPVRGGGRSRAT